MDELQYNRRKMLANQSKQRSFNKKLNREKSRNGWKEFVNVIQYKLIPYEPRWNIHNTPTHELAKGKVSFMLKQQNRLCYCEVIFKEFIGGRCDILIPDEETIIEILHSETLTDFKGKCGYYPEGYTIIPLKADDVLKEDFIL